MLATGWRGVGRHPRGSRAKVRQGAPARGWGLLGMCLGLSLDALIPLGLVFIGTALAQTDIAVQRLPNSAVGVTTVVTTTLLLIARIAGVAPERVTAAALGAVAMGVLYLIPAVLSPPSMG